MKLIIHIGGHFGTNYRIELIGNEITYWKFCEGCGVEIDPETIRPSDEQIIALCDGSSGETVRRPGLLRLTNNHVSGIGGG